MPTLACTIGQAEIGRALLDLGASINLLPFSVYQQLGLGKLSPTQITIQLADRSIKVPKGEINDVLVGPNGYTLHLFKVLMITKHIGAIWY